MNPPDTKQPLPEREDLVQTSFVSRHRHRTSYVPDDGHTHRRRILVYGLLTLFFGGLLYLLVENPMLPFLGRPLFASPSVPYSWPGLVVQSSVYTLFGFLGILLLRFIILHMMALIQWIRYTAAYNTDEDGFTPGISVIVPAYNEGKLIGNTIKSLLAQKYPNFEIIVVDDGSSDDTGDVVSQYIGEYANCTVRLVTKRNAGKAMALNAGIEVSRYDFVLCVDGDCQLTRGTLRYAIRHMKDEDIGAVAGNVKVANRNNVWTTLQALEYIEGLNIARAAQSLVRLVNIVPGPVGLFRKSAIQEVGWYDSDTFAEDCDLTIKLMRSGWRIVYEPQAISWTEAPETLQSLIKQRYRWTRGILQAVRKKHDGKWATFVGRMFVWFMAFESLVWPFMNVFANLYFVYIAVAFNLTYYLFLWWISLALLDIAAALFAVAVEREEMRLVFYALYYRLFFILIIDVCKVLATLEELFGIDMHWGKLERTGFMKPSAAV